ncbi:Disease resistance protein RGA2 [Rhynchospora pubera]|uniref:Disease resistance protein RGA2 n=1 Tax=Rhynchospora pubera TaxID=906938 RepID=A0AAV8BSS0_9POAL|nr:Disease resistance protein RGA2 [Rhynchospora pubera]
MDYIKTAFEGAAAVPSVYQCLVAPNSELSQSISRLDTTLIVASQIIERSECWCFRYDRIRKLLSYLKNAVYEAELTIEEFESQRRRAENHYWNIAGELINSFMNWATGFQNKVISAQGNLNHCCDQLEKFCNGFEIPQNPEKFSRPITVSRPPVVLYGRNKELDHAIGMLGIPRSGLYAGESSGCRESNRKIHVLPIVGIGGIGKTTLSQMVYKDKRADSYYDLKIWLCVTQKFDLERMLKEMIQYATKKGSDFTSLDLLEDTLIEAIKSKRVLLVLDDIWSSDWQQLLGPMNEASKGSAIILTSRSREHFNNSTEGNMTLLKPILLEGLEEGIYWDFFKKCAGLNVGLSNYSELEHIAGVICRRLKGLPLAAKTVGGVLKQRIDRQHWITIRDSEMWKVMRQGEDGIMHVLLLSYLHLPSVELKKCFSYCSVFSKGHEFHPYEITWFWIMNRLIPIQENLKSTENLAWSYFYELENRGFFHYIQTHDKYVMHDLMHDVCRSLRGDECYCLEDDQAFANIPPNMQYMSVCRTRLLNAENLRKLSKLKKLRTLLVAPANMSITKLNWNFPIPFSSLCNELTSIRCLSLTSCKIKEIPENIGNLKCLRYLDISYNEELKKLPQSFCNLYDLEVLNMRGCCQFSADSGFPSGCDKLRGLKYFRPPEHVVTSLTGIPCLFKAIQLYNFKYKVENCGSNRIEILKDLTGLGGSLTITGLENVLSKKEAEEARLNKQEHIEKLILCWQDEFPMANNEIHKEVLEGLCPHSNLEDLVISNYKGSDLPPRWMGKDDLPKLNSVMLKKCSNKTVSQFSCSITVLQIYECSELESLVDCLHPNLLPKMKSISIISCPKLNSLPVESFCGFMSLEKLLLKECGRLTCPTKMSLPPCIKYLELDTCGELENSIPSCLENLTSLEVLIILNCPNIVSTCPTEVSLPPSLKHLELKTCGELENSIPSCLENLTSLEVLILAKCLNLVIIPNEVMRSLPSLRRLVVMFCPNLESLGDEEFLKSMDHFFIQDCPKHPLTWEQNPNGRQLSKGALATAAPSSSDTIPQVALIEQAPTTAQDTPATPILPFTVPSVPLHRLSIDTPMTDVPSSSNPRKRKAGDQN